MAGFECEYKFDVGIQKLQIGSLNEHSTGLYTGFDQMSEPDLWARNQKQQPKTNKLIKVYKNTGFRGSTVHKHICKLIVDFDISTL